MRHIPILYSTPMVQAKIAGRKTMTRRMQELEAINVNPDKWEFHRLFDGHAKFTAKNDGLQEVYIKCPYSVGDILWTRETFIDGDDSPCSPHHEEPEQYSRYAFKADCPIDQIENITWKPSIFMPKEACRMFDKITQVGLERIADISPGDAADEGIEYWNEDYTTEDGAVYADYANYLWVDKPTHPEYFWPSFSNPIDSFRSLWTLINGKPKPIQKTVNSKPVTVGYEVSPFDDRAGSPFASLKTWRGKPLSVKINPWVWVVKYEPCERPSDFLK